MHIFARITKVDEANRKVYGRAVQEVVDRSGEIMDYETSKSNFVDWSTAIAKATDGKSVGNLRAMHGKVAAGKLDEITFVDAEKAIDIVTEVVDDNEWQKCLKGVYTGFSIGGSYAKKWPDEVNKGATRYTAKPNEISLVDLPCVPTAQFSVVKADGSEEMRKFECTTDNYEAMQKWAESLDEEAQAMLRKLFQNDPETVSAELEKRYSAIADIVLNVEKIAKRPDVDPKDGADKYGKVKYADPKNKKYPLDTEKHIRAAWSYIHMPKNAAKYSAEDLKTIKAAIAEEWKKVIGGDGPEEGDAKKFFDAQVDRLSKHANAPAMASAIAAFIKHDPGTLEKGLWAVQQLAGLLEQLACMADGVDWEEEREGDASQLPLQFRNALRPLAQAFIAMASEEVNEALHGQLNDDAALALAAANDGLAKAGARHSAKDKAAIDALAEHHAAIKKHVEEMQQHLDALKSSGDQTKTDDDETAEKLAKAATDLQKVTAERDGALAERDEAVSKLEALTKQYADWLTQPAVAKGVARVVEKTVGVQEPPKVDDEPVKKADGSIDHAATAQKMMKRAYQHPRVGLG